MIPRDEQISAALDGSLWTLKLRYCDGNALTLQSMWTVSFDDILSTAKQRGLKTFVRQRPGGDGVFLIKRGSKYEVCYMERAANIHGEAFDQLESAFIRWLKQSLQAYGLPTGAGR